MTVIWTMDQRMDTTRGTVRTPPGQISQRGTNPHPFGKLAPTHTYTGHHRHPPVGTPTSFVRKTSKTPVLVVLLPLLGEGPKNGGGKTHIWWKPHHLVANPPHLVVFGPWTKYGKIAQNGQNDHILRHKPHTCAPNRDTWHQFRGGVHMGWIKIPFLFYFPGTPVSVCPPPGFKRASEIVHPRMCQNGQKHVRSVDICGENRKSHRFWCVE